MSSLLPDTNKQSSTPLQSQKQRLHDYWKSQKIITDAVVLEAFMAVSRELFVGSSFQDQAYADHPLPIGSGQTISQPTTVMLMLQWLSVLPGNSVLEIGTGSGYNAALLGYLAESVVSIERHPELAELARKNLKVAGVSNVSVEAGDGKLGSPSHASFDRIIVTAAARNLPEALKEQLSVGGILVAPVGATHGCEMLRVRKISSDRLQTSGHGLFSFVPLV